MQRPRRDRIHAAVVQAMFLLRLNDVWRIRWCVEKMVGDGQIQLRENSPHAIISEGWTPIATYDKIKRSTFITCDGAEDRKWHEKTEI